MISSAPGAFRGGIPSTTARTSEVMKGGTVQWGEGGRARRTKKGRVRSLHFFLDVILSPLAVLRQGMTDRYSARLRAGRLMLLFASSAATEADIDAVRSQRGAMPCEVGWAITGVEV